MAARIPLFWITNQSHSSSSTSAVQHHILNNGAKLIDMGMIKLPEVEVLPYSVESLSSAHEKQETGAVIGKIVLSRV